MAAQLLVEEGSFVYPGLELSAADGGLTPGAGVSTSSASTLVATVCGHVVLEGELLRVRTASDPPFAVPLALNSIVLGRVERLRDAFAVVVLFAVSGRALPRPLRAQLKREHMRKTDIDAVKVQRMLAPGDIIRARVKSLSDSTTILVDIEEDELGVVASRSAAGRLLQPVGPTRMRSPCSGAEHEKKVAFHSARES